MKDYLNKQHMQRFSGCELIHLSLVVCLVGMLAILFWPRLALATTFTSKIVDSFDNAPMTEGYLDHMKGRAPDSVQLAPQIITKSDGGETDYLINDASYVPPTSPKTINNAVVLTYKDAGTTLLGRSLDLNVAMDVSWCHNSPDDMGYYPCFLSTPYKDYYLHLRASVGYADRPGGPGDVAHRNGIKTHIRYSITYSDTHEPCKEKILIWVQDLDQSTIGPFANESLTLHSGFDSELYVLRNTKLSFEDLKQGYLHSAQGPDDGPLTSFVGYITGGSCEFTWQGESCSTAIGAIYPATYPQLKDDPVYAPTKAIETIDGESPSGNAPYILQGQSVTFLVHQKLPYVVEDNKPVMTQLVDDLDSCLDASAAKVQVIRQGQDVTSNWKVSIAGQRVTLMALDTSLATLDLEFRITVPVKPDAAAGRYSNLSRTLVSTRTKRNIELESNSVQWNVGVVPKTLRVTKRLSVCDLNDFHGVAAFPIELKVLGKEGEGCMLRKMIVFSGEEPVSDDGTVSRQCTFNLADTSIAYPSELQLREVPTSRFWLEDCASDDDGSSKSDGTLIWDLSPGNVTSEQLSCELKNCKTEHRWLSHSAMATNTVQSHR